MSGPWAGQGYPQHPGHGGWSGGQPQNPYGGGQPQSPYGPSPYGAAPGGYPGGPQGPFGMPPKKRNIGLTVAVVVGVLGLVGGGVTAAVLLSSKKQPTSQAARSSKVSIAMGSPERSGLVRPTGSWSAMPPPTSSAGSGDSTSVRLQVGQCAGIDSISNDLVRAPCGSAQSVFVMAKTAATEAACGPDFTYLPIQGPSTVYCFTLDVREGDCLDVDVLKTPCASATQKVLRVVPGPETDSTCQDVPGVDTVVLAGPEPASVACVGPNR